MQRAVDDIDPHEVTRIAACGHGGTQAAVALARPLNSIAWELRAAWVTGRRVSLRLDADQERI